MATKLKIGSLPKMVSVKVTVQMPQTLADELERYAAAHSQMYGEKVDAAALIPHMLARFMNTDRGFKRNKMS